MPAEVRKGRKETGPDRAGFLEDTCREDRTGEGNGAMSSRPLSQREIDQKLALYAAATALAVLQGRKDLSLGDLRECSGVPHLISSKWMY